VEVVTYEDGIFGSGRERERGHWWKRRSLRTINNNKRGRKLSPTKIVLSIGNKTVSLVGR